MNPEILPQIYREIPLQNFSKEKSLSIFCEKTRQIPLKIFSEEKSLQILFEKKSTLKFCLKFTGKSLYKIFLKKNPCKIDSLFRKVVNFTKEIPLNFFSEKNHPQNFPKFQPQNWQVRHHFFKNSLHEGDFENSLKFLQLVPNLTPIRKLLCTFLYQCCYYPRHSL